MTEWFYLAFGFALLSSEIGDGSIFHRKEGTVNPRTVPFFSPISTMVTIGILWTIDLFSSYFWKTLGREDLRWAVLFLAALLLHEGLYPLARKSRKPAFFQPPFFALTAFLIWTLRTPGDPKRLLAGLALVLASETIRWLLKGLQDRMRLSSYPSILQGVPLLFILASLLFLALFPLTYIGL